MGFRRKLTLSGMQDLILKILSQPKQSSPIRRLSDGNHSSVQRGTHAKASLLCFRGLCGSNWEFIWAQTKVAFSLFLAFLLTPLLNFLKEILQWITCSWVVITRLASGESDLRKELGLNLNSRHFTLNLCSYLLKAPWQDGVGRMRGPSAAPLSPLHPLANPSQQNLEDPKANIKPQCVLG